METINDRLEIIINDLFDGKKTVFGAAMGLKNPNSITSYLRDEKDKNKKLSKPGFDLLANIVSRLNVDAKWLLTGEETPKNEIQNIGNNSSAAIQGVAINNSSEILLLKEKIAFLEARIDACNQILQEKERLIKVLLSQQTYE